MKILPKDAYSFITLNMPSWFAPYVTVTIST